MNILDRIPEEKPAKFPKRQKAVEPQAETQEQEPDEFDRLLEAAAKEPKPDIASTIVQMENLAQLAATDKYPRASVALEDVFMQTRRERVKRILMQFGEKAYIDSINNLLKVFDDPDNMEAEGGNVLRKLGTYGAEAGQLIGWLTACRYLIGVGKVDGLLKIRLDEIYYGNYEKAMKAVVEMQLGISLGPDKKTGEDKHLPPSAISTSDKLIESWIVNNVPEYQELRKDIVTVATIAETILLVLNQINQSAKNADSILRQYPAPMLAHQ